MSRIFASIALAAVAFAVPAVAADAKSEFSNVELQSQSLFKPDLAKSALTAPTEQKVVTYSGAALFSSSSLSDASAAPALDLNITAPDASTSFAAGEAAKATLTGAK